MRGAGEGRGGTQKKGGGSGRRGPQQRRREKGFDFQRLVFQQPVPRCRGSAAVPSSTRGGGRARRNERGKESPAKGGATRHPTHAQNGTINWSRFCECARKTNGAQSYRRRRKGARGRVHMRVRLLIAPGWFPSSHANQNINFFFWVQLWGVMGGEGERKSKRAQSERRRRCRGRGRACMRVCVCVGVGVGVGVCGGQGWPERGEVSRKNESRSSEVWGRARARGKGGSTRLPSLLGDATGSGQATHLDAPLLRVLPLRGGRQRASTRA